MIPYWHESLPNPAALEPIDYFQLRHPTKVQWKLLSCVPLGCSCWVEKSCSRGVTHWSNSQSPFHGCHWNHRMHRCRNAFITEALVSDKLVCREKSPQRGGKCWVWLFDDIYTKLPLPGRQPAHNEELSIPVSLRFLYSAPYLWNKILAKFIALKSKDDFFFFFVNWAMWLLTYGRK